MNTKVEATEKTFKGLRRFNLIMAALHFVQGLLMILISNDVTYPLTTAYLKFDLENFRVFSDLQEVGGLRYGPAVAAFLLISSIAHFSLATFGYKWYVKNLKKGMNPARFYEYALSSSWMIVLIAMLVGMYDIPSLVLIFSLNAMMNLFGVVMELHNQTTEKTDWTSYIYGVIAGIIPWIVIGMYFVGALSSSDARPPAFVYGIIASIFVFFNIFAINMLLQYKKVGPWKNYLFGERMYIILSLAAKTALAWQIFAGTLRPM
ncbi:MAG: heliorhodopsin HeR [Anaerolineae bacterium]|nr:heliorhodopsin HeR [Anaerolineae bacterium]